MYFSKHNIFSRIKNSKNSFIVNLLSGNADILTPEETLQVTALLKGLDIENKSLLSQLTEKGYWIDEKAELKLYKEQYLDFVDLRETDEVQLFFVPNYSCNFACSYCYQDEYKPVHKPITNAIIHTFFQYITSNFAGRKKYVTVFGGEPLLNTAHQKKTIEMIMGLTRQHNLDICFVTNGYTLEDYVPVLKHGSVREIQVTLDGTAGVHNTRRFLRNGSGTFEKIVRGIDACIQNNLTINLRMVVDKENIENLPELAKFAIDKGWTKSPFFKTQLGRNYELHHCQSSPDKLFSRISLYEELYALIKQHPYIAEFYKPSYSVSKFLAENGSLPNPLFDSCPACKTEWAFDYTGRIYSCTATVGKANEALGTFYPVVTRATEIISQWENRDVVSIPECKGCNLQLACGGGCGSVAKNKNGSIASADCRPIKELLELGFSEYLLT
jgi:uncharacterized protein